ncbi:MAG: hypothetical protein KYX64_01810, partial [Sphingopyxis sp.]|nr:hypothetical protein [Sphingopyxis sp.]
MTMPERLFLVISPRSRFPFVSSEVETPIDTAPGARGVSASFDPNGSGADKRQQPDQRHRRQNRPFLHYRAMPAFRRLFHMVDKGDCVRRRPRHAPTRIPRIETTMSETLAGLNFPELWE